EVVARLALQRGQFAARRAGLLRQAGEYERRGLNELSAVTLAGAAMAAACAGDFTVTRDHRADVERLSRPDSLPRRLLAVAIARDPSTRTLGTWFPADLPKGASMQFQISAALTRAHVALNAGRADDAVAILAPMADAFVIEGPGPAALFVYGQ